MRFRSSIAFQLTTGCLDYPLFPNKSNDLDKSFDYQSFCCLYFLQAIITAFPDAVVYAEFPEIWGFGYRTIQAKQTGLLGTNCLIGVTSHGSFEWLQEINSKFSTEQSRWYWQAHHYEQFCYENAGITYSPSHFLKSKLSDYGWKTTHVKHLPYFVPSLTLKSNKPSTTLDKTLLNKIPVVFFARLEERKGLCTFLEALKLLDSTITPRIHPIFIGKIIPLQSSQLQHLNSQEYINRELDNSFTYTLLPDLTSQEAIQAIADLHHPVVCLTSLQENFPNAALEVGQLPVSLVVSDTGGFRETLDLLQRSDAVHWFRSGNAQSLAQALTQAIHAYPENSTRIEQTEIDPINQKLLNQRLELMSQAFLEAAPKELTTPSVTIALVYPCSTSPLLECLKHLAAQTYQQFDVIVMASATDESIQTAIAQAQTQFSGYKYLAAEAHWSLGETYNYLVDQATGEYVLFLTPDHTPTPAMLETLVVAMQEANAVAVVCPQLIAAGETPEFITSVDGNLLKLLEFNHRHDLTALFSRQLLQQFRYSQERGLQALNWQIFAAAIATNQAIAYYPYPLFAIHPDSASIISTTDLAKERYYLRQYLFQIKPEQWHQRQINLLLTGFEQLAQVQSQPQQQPLSPQNQAWMLTAQQMHQELTQAQSRLLDLERWNRELQAGKEWLESQWQSLLLRSQKLEIQQDQLRSLIGQMQGSKFWKLRNRWFKLKRKLGRVSADPLQNYVDSITPGVQEFVARIAGQKIRFFQPTAATKIPVVSIISSCSDEYTYLETTYRSIINQTFQNFEWIIVDDGLDHPETKQLLQAFAQRTEKIRILSHDSPRGIAASYNTAIAQATGEFFCFLEIGSILDPTYLEKGVLFLETHPTISLVNSYSVVFQAQEHWWQTALSHPQGLVHQPGLTCHPLYRKADFMQLGGFDESLPTLERWERTLKAIANGQQGWTFPEYLDCYRTTQHSSTRVQSVITTIQSRYSVGANALTTALDSHPINLNQLNSQLNLDNQRIMPNSGKRLLLFCDALDDSEIAKWNCDLVIWLDQCGYDVTIVTTTTSNHSCQEFFYPATPDIFHLPNLFEKAHWLAFIRYILTARAIDGVMISGSELAYSFLPLLRLEFSAIAMIDYIHASPHDRQNSRVIPISCQFTEDIDCHIVPSQRAAKAYSSLHSRHPSKIQVCYTLAQVEAMLATMIKTCSANVSVNSSSESNTEALLLILESLQQ
ncbi:MAG TPA: glycosyltransferase [Leptolyngbyaceae cyanobacterium M33_DOE_097]|uniref:Glycosyltransferase n=1 Tax=Oscillatoriales cyanobacterium SpSt-418 TaxID=2282169 RepID=A0A7C3PP89_9CYAN|nr:glycosyltransferase [Leptolyngbyaceae cyanobacterium M33_DOE_097]